MNITPLQSLGILIGGGAAVTAVATAGLTAANKHDDAHPGGFPTGDVAAGAGVALAAGGWIGAMHSSNSSSMRYATLGALAIGAGAGLAIAND